ncbi:MAG: hypothetical protein HY794_04330 [Desulfarculus sp.]|nr:hypothetical protein [Desulfarculus sp.]
MGKSVLFAVAAFIVTLLVVICSGCASITQGTTQSIAVDTNPSRPAECKATNDKGSWLVKTPGAVTINKSGGPLSVICECTDGWGGVNSVQSTTGGAVYGNILVGGIIGAAVDMSSGAAYQYPATIVVPVGPRQEVTGGMPGPSIAQPVQVSLANKLTPIPGNPDDLNRFTVKAKETTISPISSRLSDAVGFLNMSLPEGGNYEWGDCVVKSVKSGDGKSVYLTESHCVIMEFAEPKNELSIAVMKTEAAKKE